MTINAASVRKLAPSAEQGESFIEGMTSLRGNFAQRIKNMEAAGLDIQVGMDTFNRTPIEAEEEDFRAYYGELIQDPDELEAVVQECLRQKELAEKEPQGPAYFIRLVDRSVKPARNGVLCQTLIPPGMPNPDLYGEFHTALSGAWDLVNVKTGEKLPPLPATEVARHELPETEPSMISTAFPEEA